MTILVLCLFVLCGYSSAFAQKRARVNQQKKKKKAEWVFLDHADDLRYDQQSRPGVQIAKGNVRFRFEGNTLTCDSALMFQFQNRFEAYGHVKMHRSADRSNLTCQHATYNSMTRLFQARKNVVVTQPGSSLHCDSLDYNGNSHQVTYMGHGRLTGRGITVISERGEYNTKTKDSHFTGKRVVLRSQEYNITTPDLTYNTETKDGHVQGKSVIKTRNGETVHTDNADFNGISHSFVTHSRSTITSPERDIEGDNMNYDRSTGYGEGHGKVRVNDKRGGRIITGDNVKFRTAMVTKGKTKRNEVVEFEGEGNAKIIDKPAQRTVKGDLISYNTQTQEGYGEGNVDYIDHKQKNAFLGDYIHYTPLNGVAYGHAIGKEFSQGDTLFVHADTILMKGRVRTDTIRGKAVQDTVRTFYGVDNVRAFRTDVQAVCGLLIAYTADSSMTMYKDPIVWSGPRQLLGDSIRCYMNDSTIREAHVMGNAFSIETMSDGQHYNQISSRVINGYFTGGKLQWGDAIGNVYVVYYPIDDKDSTYIGLNYTETDTIRFFMNKEVDRKLEKIWMPKANGVLYPMNQIPADKKELRGFALYDYIRPVDKYDLFRHATKGQKKDGNNTAATQQPPKDAKSEEHKPKGNGGSADVVTSKGNKRRIIYPSKENGR